MYICGDYGELHTKRVGFVFFVFCVPPYNTYINIYVHGTSITSNTSNTGGGQNTKRVGFLYFGGVPPSPPKIQFQGGRYMNMHHPVQPVSNQLKGRNVLTHKSR